MKKFLAGIPFFLFCLAAFPQKVNVHVVRFRDVEWQILDAEHYPVYPGSALSKADSTVFSLETDKEYYLYVSVKPNQAGESNLLLLYIDNEPVILINGDKTGDLFFPFYTGVRQPETKITGGTNALLSEFPWQIYLVSGNFACGGSIIAPNWILTAAHCVVDSAGYPISPDLVTVKAGANNPFNANEGVVYNAAQVIPNAGYSRKTLENDIALIRLQTSIVNATPVRIVTSYEEGFGVTNPGVMTWVTGWGTTSPTVYKFPTQLQKVQLPIVTTAQASTVWRDIPSTVIMAGYRNGTKDACSGDSGGPMVVDVLGEYRLAGLVSWGSEDCNTYGAYTRVSLFENWIYSRTGISAPFIPSAITGDTVICNSGNTTYYSVSPVSGIESYEWKILPAAAGSVSGSSSTAAISWNIDYTGSAELAYRVRRGGIISEWSRLSLNVVDETKLLIVPQDQVLCENMRLTFDAEAKGYKLSYAWYFNGDLLRTSQSPDLVINPVKPQNSGDYVLEARGYCNVLRSRPISLIVNPLTEVNSVSPDVTLPFGSDHVLSVNATGHQLRYQWIKENTPVQGAAGNSLNLTNVNASDIANYRVIVSGTCGTVTTDSIFVFVSNERQPGGPGIYLWPTVTDDNFNLAVDKGDPYDILIIDTSGKAQRIYRNLRYQNNIDISKLPKGLYIVSVRGKDFHKSIRIIKN
ncbi:MAG TPA: trypsin-like serine protease [Bacteroidales bacterium]|nr:trypsin-like serine protease [Bacteroidales bacterium]